MFNLNTIIQKLYTSYIASKLGSCGKNNLFITFSKFFVPQNIHIGNKVFINQQCILGADAKITIHDNVSIGFRVSLITSNNEINMDPKTRKRVHYDEPIVIEKNVWIGANATVLSGVTVGEGSVVAAGAVVTRDVPPYTLVGGVPARVIKKVEFNDDYAPIDKHYYSRMSPKIRQVN